MSPALAGMFFDIEPPGKPTNQSLLTRLSGTHFANVMKMSSGDDQL